MFLMINLGERAGSGLPKIRQGWEATGNALHLFDAFEPYDQTRLEMSWGDMAVETRKVTGKTPEKMSEKTSEKTSEKILAAMRRNSGITIAELATIVGVTGRTIERNIQKLQQENLLRRVGPDKGGYWEVIDD
jgi:predicted HTH transcriptional regulator